MVIIALGCILFSSLLDCSSVVVSAGIVRIFGSELAELPLVATSNDHQGKVVIVDCGLINLIL